MTCDAKCTKTNFCKMIICFNDEVILNKDYLLIPIRKIGKNFKHLRRDLFIVKRVKCCSLIVCG